MNSVWNALSFFTAIDFDLNLSEKKKSASEDSLKPLDLQKKILILSKLHVDRFLGENIKDSLEKRGFKVVFLSTENQKDEQIIKEKVHLIKTHKISVLILLTRTFPSCNKSKSNDSESNYLVSLIKEANIPTILQSSSLEEIPESLFIAEQVPHLTFTTFAENENLKESEIRETFFPIREEFTRETSWEVVSKIREHLGISLKAKVILILLKCPLTDERVGLERAIRKFFTKREKNAPPLHIVIFNPLSSLNFNNDPRLELPANIKWEVKETPNNQELSDYLKTASDAVIGQPPGLVIVTDLLTDYVAKAIKMGVFITFLDFHYFPVPEFEANYSYIKRHALGSYCSLDSAEEEDSLWQFIERTPRESSSIYSPLKWEENFFPLLEKALSLKN